MLDARLTAEEQRWRDDLIACFRHADGYRLGHGCKQFARVAKEGPSHDFGRALDGHIPLRKSPVFLSSLPFEEFLPERAKSLKISSKLAASEESYAEAGLDTVIYLENVIGAITKFCFEAEHQPKSWFRQAIETYLTEYAQRNGLQPLRVCPKMGIFLVMHSNRCGFLGCAGS